MAGYAFRTSEVLGCILDDLGGSWVVGQCASNDLALSLVLDAFLRFFWLCRWGGGAGGDKNVIHIVSMPKTLVFAAFSPLCTTSCTRMWNKKICHKRPCLSRPCPKNGICSVYAQNTGICIERFHLFVQHPAQGCGTRKSVRSVYLALKNPKHAVPKRMASLKPPNHACPKRNSFWNPRKSAFLLRTTPASTNDVSRRPHPGKLRRVNRVVISGITSRVAKVIPGSNMIQGTYINLLITTHKRSSRPKESE